METLFGSNVYFESNIFVSLFCSLLFKSLFFLSRDSVDCVSRICEKWFMFMNKNITRKLISINLSTARKKLVSCLEMFFRLKSGFIEISTVCIFCVIRNNRRAVNGCLRCLFPVSVWDTQKKTEKTKRWANKIKILNARTSWFNLILMWYASTSHYTFNIQHVYGLCSNVSWAFVSQENLNRVQPLFSYRFYGSVHCTTHNRWRSFII